MSFLLNYTPRKAKLSIIKTANETELRTLSYLNRSSYTIWTDILWFSKFIKAPIHNLWQSYIFRCYDTTIHKAD